MNLKEMGEGMVNLLSELQKKGIELKGNFKPSLRLFEFEIKKKSILGNRLFIVKFAVRESIVVGYPELLAKIIRDSVKEIEKEEEKYLERWNPGENETEKTKEIF